MQLSTFLILATSLASVVTADVSTSTVRLSQLLATETKVVSLLQDYIQQTELNLNTIRRYVETFRHIKPNNKENPVEIVSNPLNAYQLLKILTIDWPKLQKSHEPVKWQDVLRKINNWKKNVAMSAEEDLYDAADGLLRLQETYRLNASDLANGNILDIQSSVKLTARDCLFLGKHAYEKDYINLAIEWYDEALRVADTETDATATKHEIRHYLKRAIATHDSFLTHGFHDYTFQEPFHGRTPREMKHVLMKKQHHLRPNMTNTLEYTFQALCRGEKLKSAKEEKDLLCYLFDHNDPYYILHPIKVEEHSLYSPIYSFYDVISDTEIEQLKNMATPFLARAEVIIYEPGKNNKVSPFRTIHTTGIDDNATNHTANFSVQNIINRISWITQLNVEGRINSNILQVGNYGIGGHYDPHYDYLFKDITPEELQKLDPELMINGDRIATFMFYLSDVRKGGAIAFPYLQTAIFPKKGSAVFWYNLLQSGEPDRMTLHGACPVLHGSKWIAIKWIKDKNQAFTRSCGLTPEE